jgi:hypothetical protein
MLSITQRVFSQLQAQRLMRGRCTLSARCSLERIENPAPHFSSGFACKRNGKNLLWALNSRQ